jgi:hypothetical protein
MPQDNALDTSGIPTFLLPVYEAIHNADSADDVFEIILKHNPGVTRQDIAGKERTQRVSFPRQQIMYAIREVTDLSYEDIGSMFLGGRDHSTVLYGRNKVKSKINASGLLERFISGNGSFLELPKKRGETAEILDGEYALGEIKTFWSPGEATSHINSLKRKYGKKVRMGPAINTVSGRQIRSGNRYGFYFHKAVISEEPEQLQLVKGKSMTLEEAVQLTT